MKATLSTKDLRSAVKASKQAISTRSTLPILAGVLVSAEEGDDYLTLHSTDLQVALAVVVPATVMEAGSTVIPWHAFTNATSTIDAETVTLEAIIDEDALGNQIEHTRRVEIMEEGGKIELRALPAEDFPKAPKIDKPIARMTITDVPTFARLAKETLAATSSDETRPVLTGVLLKDDPNGLRMVATDSYRLHARFMAEGVTNGIDGLVPGTSIKSLLTLLGKKPSDVTLTRGENRVSFGFVADGLGVHLTSRLIEGQFPNYKQLIPADATTTATVDRAALLALTKKVGKFALHSSPLRMDLNGKGTLRAASQDVGGICYDFEIEKTGADIEIAVNAIFLEQMLATFGSEQVRIETTSPLKPAMIFSGESAEDFSLIMPVRIS